MDELQSVKNHLAQLENNYVEMQKTCTNKQRRIEKLEREIGGLISMIEQRDNRIAELTY